MNKQHIDLADALASSLGPASVETTQPVSFRYARSGRQRNSIGQVTPHARRALPSCTVVQVEGAGSRLPTAIPRGTELITKAQPACRFRTVYDVTIAPVAITAARFVPCVDVPPALGVPAQSACALSITIESTDSAVALDEAVTRPLRLFVDADDGTRAAFHDALFTRALCTCVQAGRQWCQLAASPFVPVGYGDDEALLPTQAGVQPGLRLLAEFFAFPEKFAFFDIDLKPALARCPSGTRRLVVHVMLPALPTSALLQALSGAMLRLGCTPVVNLFRRAAEPLLLAAGRNTYPLRPFPVPDADATVYSVDGVTLLHALEGGNLAVELPRFDAARRFQGERFWLARHADTAAGAERTISFVDSDERALDLSGGTVAIGLTCTNGSVPASLPIGRPDGDLTGDGACGRYPVRMLRRPSIPCASGHADDEPAKPTAPFAPEPRQLTQEALPALLDMLRMYAGPDNAAVQRKLAGIVGLEQRATKAWVRFPQGAAYMQGIQVRLTIDEAAFDRCGVFAFAQVMERFFALYARDDSFTQLVVVTVEGEERVRCGARAGAELPG
jgi:type VI secretion system protein ImpG